MLLTNVKKHINKNILKIIILNICLVTLMSVANFSYAVTIKDVDDKEEVDGAIKGFILLSGNNGINKSFLEEAIDLYNQITPQYTNNEIIAVIEKNMDEFVQSGVKKEDLDSIITVLKRVDTVQLKKVLGKIDIEEIATRVKNGESTTQILKVITDQFSTSEKVDIIFGTLLSTKIIKNFAIVIIVLAIYRTLLRCVIYKKAHKKAWASFIPVYRNVVMLKICNMSPCWLLLLLVPVVGWIILWIVSVASKFMLAEAFGKGTGFAFGLWLLAPIFETVLVFSKKTKYIGFEDEFETENQEQW